MDDRSLITRCVRGDRSAWDEVVVRFGRLVYAVIVRTLRRHEVAVDEARLDEAFTATFLALADDDSRRMRQWDGRCSLASWVRLVTVSTVLDSLRSERRACARIDGAAEVELLPLDGADVLDRALHAERIVRLERALERLAEGDRALLRQLYNDELEVGSVAAQLGISAATLYTRKSRALDRLRAAFARVDADDL